MNHADLSALSTADLTHMIHILDTEHPWEVHSVSSGHSEAITCLEWDQSGEAVRAEYAAFLSSVPGHQSLGQPRSLGVQSGEGAPSSLPAYQKSSSHMSSIPGSRLLSADADGQIKCWSMADHLANSWESSVGSQVEGDPIVALSWLHNGVKLALHVEKVSDISTQGVGGWNPEPPHQPAVLTAMCCGIAVSN